MSQKDGIIPFGIKFVVAKVTKVTDQRWVTEPLTCFGFFPLAKLTTVQSVELYESVSHLL